MTASGRSPAAGDSPLLVWQGEGDVPNFCPEGCGGLTEDVYGGPCQACWAKVDEQRHADEDSFWDEDEEVWT